MDGDGFMQSFVSSRFTLRLRLTLTMFLRVVCHMRSYCIRQKTDFFTWLLRIGKKSIVFFDRRWLLFYLHIGIHNDLWWIRYYWYWWHQRSTNWEPTLEFVLVMYKISFTQNRWLLVSNKIGESLLHESPAQESTAILRSFGKNKSPSYIYNPGRPGGNYR